MSKIYTLYILLPLIAFSQTIDSSLAYYPLQIGNYWEYQHFSYNGANYDTLFFSLEVIGDARMLNNIEYKVLLKKSIPDTSISKYLFERIDSITCNTYRYSPGFPNDEALQDSLKAQPGDTIRNSWRGYFAGLYPSEILCTSATQDSILDILTTVKSFKDDDWTTDYTFKLAKDLGLIYEYNTDMFFISRINLLYANIDGVSYGTPLSIKNNELFQSDFTIYQNFPNPFNSRTVIPFKLPKARHIEISIFDLSGKEISTIYKGIMSEGYHELIVDGNNLASGVYYYQIKSEIYTQTKKFILLK